MTRQVLDRELLRLRDEVLVLGDMVETALVDSVRYLKRQDLEGARRLIAADPRHGQQISYLIWVLHNLERLVDRVVNLCERAVFAVTGEMVELGTADKSIAAVH